MTARRGSVLMEFVVVAPLYFVLLGGLFFVGELSLSRIRLHVGDHAATWLGGTRFCPGEADLGAFLRDSLFTDAMEPIGTVYVDQSLEEGHVNEFMAFFKGGIVRLEVSLPAWASGMMSMPDALAGREGAFPEDEPYTFLKEAEDNYRAFSFHRLEPWPATHKRDASAQELVSDGILSSVVLDAWISGGAETDATAADIPPSRGDDATIKRVLSEWAE